MESRIEEQEKKFTPLKLEINIESLDELVMLWSMFNDASISYMRNLRENINSEYYDELYGRRNHINTVTPWELLDDHIRSSYPDLLKP